MSLKRREPWATVLVWGEWWFPSLLVQHVCDKNTVPNIIRREKLSPGLCTVVLFGHHYTVRPLSDGVYMSEVEDLTLKTARWPTSELLQMEQPLRLHVCSSVEWTEVTAATASLQGCGMKDFTQLILSLRRWHWVFLILAFEVEPVEFTGDDRQSLSLGLGQKHAHVHRRQQADHRERYETVLLQSTLKKKTGRSPVSVGGRGLLGGVCGWTESWTDHQKRENHPNDEQVDPHHGSGDHVGCRPSGLVKDLCGQNPRHTSWGKTANTYIYTVY